MRKIILGLAVSLDGFIEGPNGEYDWCFTDQDYGLNQFFKQVDTVFMGRRSYETLLGMNDNGGLPRMKEYVFSNTLQQVREGTQLVKGDLKQRVNEIRKEAGKDIWLFGGAALTSSMMNAGLVDELWLSVHPILLGSGKPLFQNIEERILLKLVETRSYDTGLVSLKYTLK